MCPIPPAYNWFSRAHLGGMVTLELADLLPGVELPTLSRLGRGSSERGRDGWGLGPYQRTPEVSCDRAIGYSGLGVRETWVLLEIS